MCGRGCCRRGVEAVLRRGVDLAVGNGVVSLVTMCVMVRITLLRVCGRRRLVST